MKTNQRGLGVLGPTGASLRSLECPYTGLHGRWLKKITLNKSGFFLWEDIIILDVHFGAL
jgi:hypothetical protein